MSIYINKNFERVPYEDKIEWIKGNPEKILLIEREEVERIESKPRTREYYELYAYKAAALRSCGELALIFEENGFKLDHTLMKIAFKSNPSIGKHCERKWLTPYNVRKMLRADVRNYVYVPAEMFDERLIKYFQTHLRKQLSKNPALYKQLPPEIVNGHRSAFTAINSYTNNGREINALKVSPQIWETNGGKLMFKIARRNLDVALKMLKTTERETLAIELLKHDVTSYEQFPKSLKENPNVLNRLYAILKETNNMELVVKYFGTENIPALDKKYATNKKISEKLKEKYEHGEVKPKSPRIPKGQQCLFTKEELNRMER